VQITADQRELQDLVRRFFQDAVPSEYLRKRITSLLRRDEALIESLKQLGLDEGFSGSGGGFSFAELGLVAEEAGRALFPEPLSERLLGDAVIPGTLSEASRKGYNALGSGTAFAPASCCDLILTAKSKRVSGEVVWALGVEGAARIIAAVEFKGAQRLFACGLDQEGVTHKHVSSLDLTTALSALSLKDVSVVLFTEEESRFIQDAFEILKACEVYGVTARVVEMSAEYLKTREQFGVPIGAFQAVQQRIADAYALSESLGALCRFAAWSVNSSPEQRPLTARAALSHASEVGPSVCEAAIQVHGGIGFTWEYDLHLYLRRAKAIQAGFPASADRVEELLKRAQS
jgi:alkylation response protein AidB-like acyl-CoA dehydrogenase